jgi:hypothetical protein
VLEKGSIEVRISLRLEEEDPSIRLEGREAKLSGGEGALRCVTGSRVLWITPVTLAAWEAEIRRTTV